jgi:hypothetical protein
MNRAEFLGLPVATQVRLLVEVLKLDKELAMLGEPPRAPRPPKYDCRISRKGGYQWASETDLEGLRWWFNRFTTSAADGGQYAEKDQKRADKLAYWVAWREVAPDARWTGQRNDTVCTAQPPVAKPRVHEWEPRGQMPLTPKSEAHEDTGADDEIPF